MARVLRWAATVSFACFAAVLCAQEGPQRAKIKGIDADGNTLTLTVGTQDRTFHVTPDTKLRGADNRDLDKRLQSPELKAGVAVMFLARDANGKQTLIGMRLQGAGGGGTPPPLVKVDSSRLKPLTELSGKETYQGHIGGLYGKCRNERPAAHAAAGVALAKQVRPLDAEGKPSPDGKIVLLSVGMSNTSQASGGFQQAIQGNRDINPHVLFVNGAVGGMTARAIQNPNDNGPGTKYWTEVAQRLAKAGATAVQVQAIWIKEADAGPREGFPGYAKSLEEELTRIVQLLPGRFPNLKLVYLSSRTYGGFAETPLNPEPYAYESAFSVQWLIEKQLEGDPALNYDAKKGSVRAPWLSWGPYLWANGTKKRTGDGFHYEREDFAKDGTHLSQSGVRKVGGLLLDFFKGDSTTRIWFTKAGAEQ
jgi:hypothetical protein